MSRLILCLYPWYGENMTSHPTAFFLLVYLCFYLFYYIFLERFMFNCANLKKDYVIFFHWLKVWYCPASSTPDRFLFIFNVLDSWDKNPKTRKYCKRVRSIPKFLRHCYSWCRVPNPDVVINVARVSGVYSAVK